MSRFTKPLVNLPGGKMIRVLHASDFLYAFNNFPKPHKIATTASAAPTHVKATSCSPGMTRILPPHGVPAHPDRT